MARPACYHVWHRAAFDALGPFSSTTISVPPVSGSGVETKTVYSLKKDMEQLRAVGKAKGIVDDTVVSVGKSTEGKELWALKVGKGSQHRVLFTGCHHSREWISVEIPYLVAEYLIQNYTDTPGSEKEKRIKHLLTNREIWFVPMVNPDGHEFTMSGPPAIGSRPSARRWRPNRKKYSLQAATFSAPRLGGGSRSISHPDGIFTGVDVNRNYPTATWGQETFQGGDVKTSRDPQDSDHESIWCGPSAKSELETQAIVTLLEGEPKFRANITYHSFGQVVFFPDAAVNDTFLQDVGNGMKQLIAQSGNPYKYLQNTNPADLSAYPTTGEQIDFSYEKAKGRPTYTVELRPKDNAPAAHHFSGLLESEINDCFVENLPAALALINCAGFNSAATVQNCRVNPLALPPAGGASPLFLQLAQVCQVVDNCWNVFMNWKP